MARHCMNVVKGIMVGLTIGGIAGMITAAVIKPKHKRFKRRTAHALDTIGCLMQNVADYTCCR